VTVYLVVPLLVVVAVIQTSVIPHLTVWGVSFDLPLLVVVSWGLMRGAREGVVWGFVGGLVVDALSGAPMGAVTMSLMAAGGLSGLGQATVVRARFLFPSAAAFLATILSTIIFLLVLEISGQPLPWLDALLRIAMPAALLNAVLMPLVFLLMSALQSWLRRDEIEW
jgi:rod shape-determining protein MreD